jgi:hypothetical protein
MSAHEYLSPGLRRGEVGKGRIESLVFAVMGERFSAAPTPHSPTGVSLSNLATMSSETPC